MKQRAKQLICTLLMAVMVMGYLLPLTAEASTDCPWITNCEQLTLRIDAENRVDSDGGISKVTTENKCDDKNCKDFVGQQNKVCNERINAVSSSRSRQAACNHTYAYVTTKAATCTQDGRQTYQCTKCGLVNTQAPGKTIPKLGHNMKRVTTKQPTCGATGTYVTKCTRCGVGDPNGNGSIAATGNHNWTLKSTTAATCVADGKKVFKCSVCGQSKTETLAKLGHSWNMSSANCTTAKKCTRCGTIGQNALGHSYQTIITKDATCGAQGTYTTKCIRCGAAGSGGYIAPTGNHKWNRNESSCTEAKKCTVCGTVAEAAKGHTWNLSSPNCTTDKKCTKCGTVSQKALGHNWNLSSPDCTTDKKCTRCGTMSQKALGHNWNLSSPDCTTDKKCTRCGTVSQKALGHNWNLSSSNCTTDKKCTRCGSISQKALGHDYKTVTTENPTCGVQGTYVIECTRCKDQNGSGYINPTGNHVWNRNAATCLEAKKCTVCGTVGEAAKGHSWNVDRATCVVTKKCTECGVIAENASGHTYQQVVIQEAGCETPGIYVTKCRFCDEEGPDGIVMIAPTGHAWTPGEFSCTENRECTLCGKVAVAPGHDYKTYVIKEAGCISQGIYETRCSVCGDVSGTGYLQPTGEHNWLYVNYECMRICRDCGLQEEHHSYVRGERKGATECVTETYRICSVCKEEVIIQQKHIEVSPEWKVSVNAKNDCSKGFIWRKCPKCKGEFQSAVSGHDFVNGICQLCGKSDKENETEKYVVMVVGDEYDEEDPKSKWWEPFAEFYYQGIDVDVTVKFADETNTVGQLIETNGYAGNIITREYNNLTDNAVLGELDNAEFFIYAGHGEVDVSGENGSLSVTDGIAISSQMVTDAELDLKNLKLASLMTCKSAMGKHTEDEKHIFDGVTYDEYTHYDEGRIDFNDVDRYSGSIAYTLCERGALVSIGCKVNLQKRFTYVWEKKFFEFYPQILSKAEMITNEADRNAFIRDMTYCLAMSVTQETIPEVVEMFEHSSSYSPEQKEYMINLCRSYEKYIVVFTNEKVFEDGKYVEKPVANTLASEHKLGLDRVPVLHAAEGDYYVLTVSDYMDQYLECYLP